MQRLSVVLAILVLSAVGRPVQAAQADGHADISRPGVGDTVSGVVTILGSASSSTFDRYELSFAYDPNPTDTWFPIGEPISTQVSFGRLGLWDTSGITDGIYALRLTVILEDGGVLPDVVGGIIVRNQASEEGPTGAGAPASTPVPESEAASPGRATAVIELATTSAAPSSDLGPRGRGIDVTGVVLGGAGVSILGLFGVGAYVFLRRNLRHRWGAIRSRRIHTGANSEGRGEGRRT